MRIPSRAACASASAFLAGWRAAAARAYRRQYGLVASLPIAWACVDAYILPDLSCLGFLSMALFLEERPGRRLACLSLAYACLSLLLACRPPPRAAFPLSGSFQAEGILRGFPSRQRLTAFTLETDQGDYRVRAPEPDFALSPGQRLRVRARWQPAAIPTNPGQFDYPAYLRSQNLRGVLLADSLALLAGPGPWDRLVDAARSALARGLDRAVPEPRAALLRAALLGDTDGLEPALVDDFKASGMLHILAISGQHVGILALILLQVFALLRLPRKAAFVATGAALALYVPVCGGQISVLRAAIMFWSGLPGVLWERPSSALNNLGWAAAATLACMPWTILTLGFQLSFAATFLLILYARPMAALLARLKVRGALWLYLVSTPALSLVLFLGAYPVLAAVSHTTAPSSILGNVATIGISSGMLVAACLALLASPLAIAASCFGACAGALGTMLAGCVHALAHGPGASLSAASWPLPWSLALIGAVLAFPYAARTGRGPALVLLAAAAFAGRWAYAAAREAYAPVTVAFLDVGQGDGAVCRLPGSVILIDAGPEPAGREAILPYLRHEGIDRIDLAVITHPDLDHYGGMAWLAGHIAIGKVLYPGVDADTRAWRDMRAELERRGIPLDTAARGQSLYASAGISLRVLSPERAGQYADRNDNSVVALLETPRRRILFTGDLGPEAEARLQALEPARLAGAILKVPHHGSDLSNPYAFLQAVRPGIAVLSAGRANKFGHPGPATVAALQGLGADLFLTARDGAVRFRDRSGPGEWARFLAADTSAPIHAPPRGKRHRAPHRRRL
jgi:competence protein ComEC